jgi:ornithine decarboxylase
MDTSNVVLLDPGRNFRGPGAPAFRNSAEVIRVLAPEYPVYCFSRWEIRRQAAAFLSGFSGETAYAVKANAHPLILAALAEAGLRWFDVASLDEIALVRSIEPKATLLYDNPVKSRAEIRRAYDEFRVRAFALDDARELRKIRAAVGNDPTVLLNVRFKLSGVRNSFDLSSKFGAVREDAVQLLRDVVAAGYRPALTFHPGSQCTEPGAYAEHIRAAAEIADAAGVTLVMLNVGGGFPVPYVNNAGPALEDYFRTVDAAYREHFDPAACRLVCEPGRALAAPAVSLLTRVKHRRSGNTVFLNDGTYGGLLELKEFRLQMPVRAFRAGRLLIGPSEEFEVFGPTCDSHDRLPLPLPLPAEVAEGDWIEFGLMGAYGSATATRFNGFSSEEYVEVVDVFTGR